MVAVDPEQLNSIVQLFKALIPFVGKAKERRAAVFDKIIAPLFADLEVVSRDYYNMIKEARDAFIAEPRKVEEVLLNLELNREAIILSRNNILGTAEATYRRKLGERALLSKEDEVNSSIRNFGYSVLNFFKASDEGRHGTGVSSLAREIRSNIEFLEREAGRKNDDRYGIVVTVIEDEFASALKYLEMRWIDVSAAYARVKMHCAE